MLRVKSTLAEEEQSEATHSGNVAMDKNLAWHGAAPDSARLSAIVVQRCGGACVRSQRRSEPSNDLLKGDKGRGAAASRKGEIGTYSKLSGMRLSAQPSHSTLGA